jgi:oligopeptide/dipeptide ABC transporter ATP-binding protein
MALEPRFIVADEPLSMVDVSARAEIMNVILRLREEFNTGFLYITHDLSAARHLCSEIAVMYLGRFVEVGPAGDVFGRPSHPYTKLLESAIPSPGLISGRPRVSQTGEPPEPRNLPRGCAFEPRCALATRVCVDDNPDLVTRGPGWSCACHNPIPGEPKLDERNDEAYARYV